MEAGGKDGGEDDPRFVASGDHLVDAAEGDVEWLLADDMLASLGRRQAGLHVRPAGGADGDDIDGGVRQ